MPNKRQIQFAEEVAHAASLFLLRESNHESLITVTRADTTSDLKHARIYLSVLPSRFEDDALLFAQRRTTDFRQYLKAHTRLGHLPHIDWLLDEGEKNRQRIDDLTRQ